MQEHCQETALLLEGNKLHIVHLQHLLQINKLETLAEATQSLYLIFCSHSNHKVKEQRNIADTIDHLPSEKREESSQEVKEAVLKNLTEEEVVALFKVLQGMCDKLQGTWYECTIRQTAHSLFGELKHMPALMRLHKSREMIDLLPEKTSDGEREAKLRSLLRSNTLFQNIDQQLTAFSNIVDIYEFFTSSVLPILTEGILPSKNKDRIPYLIHCCQLFQRVIPPLELEVQVEKNALSESRRYKPVLEREFLRHQSRILSAASKLLNEMILCPSEMELQVELFVLLRRMYYLWGQPLQNPIYVVICNIVLYSRNEVEIKQVAIFAFRLIQDKSDLYLGILISDSDTFRFLKSSPYFSSKAYAFLDESNCNFNTSDLKLPFLKTTKQVECGEVKVYTMLVEKPATLACWEFFLRGYDIRFGVYRVEDLGKLQLLDYEQEKSCKGVVKLSKYTAKKGGYNGCVLLKAGLYRLVFDNSYSYLRSKEVLCSFTVLQPV